MADIMYLQDEDSEEVEDTGCESDTGTPRPTEVLSPLERLEECANSDKGFCRQVAARLLLETLRSRLDTPSDTQKVIEIMRKLGEDKTPGVRAELAEQITNLALFFHEDKDTHCVIVEDLLPMVVKYLADVDNQVRKVSQVALVVMIEQGLIDKKAIEEKVCPVILMLTEKDTLVEFHTLAVTLMGKLAPLIGSELTEKLFLTRFATLCNFQIFYVRKVCATTFGDICAVISNESMENILIPRFVELCKDSIWGVRKACAEIFMSVSCCCTMQLRKEILAPLFESLLTDSSRWVRISAHQTLGPFISTFCDPEYTGLTYTPSGELVLINPDAIGYKEMLSRIRNNDVRDSELSRVTCELKTNENVNECSRRSISIKSYTASAAQALHQGYEQLSCNSLTPNLHSDNNATPRGFFPFKKCFVSNQDQSLWDRLPPEGSEETHEFTTGSSSESRDEQCNECIANDKNQTDSDRSMACSSKAESCQTLDLKTEDTGQGQVYIKETDGRLQIHVQTGGDSFNTFQFWRAPIPELHLDISLTEEGKPAAVQVKALVTDDITNRTYSSELNVDMEDCSRTETPQMQCVTATNTELVQIDASTEAVNLKSNPITDRSDSKAWYSKFTTKKNFAPAFVKRAKFKLFTQNQEGMIDNVSCNKQKQDDGVTCTKEKEENMTCGEEKQENVIYKREEEENIPCSKDQGDGFVNLSMEDVRQPPLPSVPATKPAPQQNIVPEPLIELYVFMIHPSQAQNTDNDIAHHCAFSFPAVALTLGRHNWHLLKEAYETLASDLQWKVRRTVASSIHELAVILGEDIATEDLVPIYSDFIKDLDEVRIGALKHLADFLKLIKPCERHSFLPRLTEFLSIDNDWNWRFREELAEQLVMSVKLFTPLEVRKYLVPLAVALLMDRVANVRSVALRLMTQLIQQMSVDAGLLHGLLSDIAEQFAHCKKWAKRQTYAILSGLLAKDRVLSEDVFASDVLPHLLSLSWDEVPNVRLTVARCMSLEIISSCYFSHDCGPHFDAVYEAIERLQNDDDKDVRYCANLHLCELARDA